MVVQCVNRVASVGLGILYTVGYMLSAFLICFLFSNGSGMEKILVLGILVLVLSFTTMCLSGAGMIYASSLSVRQIWKRNLHAKHKKIAKMKYKEYQWLLTSLPPIQIEVGGCYHWDQQAVIPFYETVFDKIFLLSKLFPSATSKN